MKKINNPIWFLCILGALVLAFVWHNRHPGGHTKAAAGQCIPAASAAQTGSRGVQTEFGSISGCDAQHAGFTGYENSETRFDRGIIL